MSLVETPDALPAGTLGEHEQVIERGLQSFVSVGNALLAIKVGRLYREAGFDTFEDYCQRRWQISRSRGYQLVTAAATVEALYRDLPETSTTVDIPVPLPTNEAQVRPLGMLPTTERAEAWTAAVVEAEGEPTGEQVQAEVDRRLGIDRGAGAADDREVPPSVSLEQPGAPTPAPEPAQHENEGAADECPPPAAPLPPRLSAEEQAELDHAEAINRRRKNLAAIHSNWATFESLRTNPDRAEILRGLAEHDRQFILELERRVSWKA